MRIQCYIHLITCVTLLGFGFGCACRNIRPPTSPAFFEEELRSRHWQNSNAQTMALVNLDNITTKMGEILAIAKYGDTNTGAIKCLEFFRVIPKEFPRERDTFVLLYHDWGPREGNWRDTDVVSVKPEALLKGVYFRITRKILKSSGNSSNEGVMYGLDYNLKDDYKMTLNHEEFFVNLSGQNSSSTR